MADENTTAVDEQAEPEIDFFGFTGKDKVHDIRDYFNNNPEQLISIAHKVSEKTHYLGAYLIIDYLFSRVFTTEQWKSYKEESENKREKALNSNNNDALPNYTYENCFYRNKIGIDEPEITDNTSLAELINYLSNIETYGYNGQLKMADYLPKIQNKYFVMNELEMENKDTEESRMSSGYIGEKIESVIELGRKQIVLTGAPGTGKTYGVREYVAGKLGTNIDALDNNERFKFVQFHASYNYVDFVEGLKPAMINGQQTFVHMDGIFKAFCRKAAADTNSKNLYYFVIDEINRADLSSVFGELMFCLEESYRGKKGQTITQYHNLPTYCYIEEKPNDVDTEQEVSADSEEITEPISTESNNYCEQLKNDLLQAIDIACDTRCYESLKNNVLNAINSFNGFKTGSTDNVKILTDDVFAEGLFIPENVIIIGTMNDIDRNVETFDFALRRRFRWIDVDADKSLDILDKVLNDSVKVDEFKKHAKALNEVINKDDYHLGAAFKLGQAYFTKFKGNDYGTYFDNELRSILEEYMRGKKHSETFINECKVAFVNGMNDSDRDSSNG